MEDWGETKPVYSLVISQKSTLQRASNRHMFLANSHSSMNAAASADLPEVQSSGNDGERQGQDPVELMTERELLIEFSDRIFRIVTANINDGETRTVHCDSSDIHVIGNLEEHCQSSDQVSARLEEGTTTVTVSGNETRQQIDCLLSTLLIELMYDSGQYESDESSQTISMKIEKDSTVDEPQITSAKYESGDCALNKRKLQDFLFRILHRASNALARKQQQEEDEETEQE